MEDLALGVWFWRVTSTSGASTSPRTLRVVGNARTPVRQGLLYGSDVNGDGSADLVLGQSVLVSDPARPRQLGRIDVLTLADCHTENPTQAVAIQRCWPKGDRTGELGDVDGDGIDDLAHFSTIWRGRATRPSEGAQEPSGELSIDRECESASAADVVRLGDVDRDGYADLAFARRCAATATAVSRCKSWTERAGGPAAVLGIARSTIGPYREIVGGGDVDGDGYDDLVALAGRASVALHRGGPNGLRSEPDLVVPVGGVIPGCDDDEQFAPTPRLSMLDVDRDGLADVVVVTHETADRSSPRWMVTTLLGARSPSLREVRRFSWVEPRKFPELRIAPLEAPGGSPTLAIVGGGDFSNDVVFLAVPQVAGVPASRYERPYASGQGVHNMLARAVGDVTGDGLDDLLLTMVEDLGIEYHYELVPGRPGGPHVLQPQDRWRWAESDDDGLARSRPPEHGVRW